MLTVVIYDGEDTSVQDFDLVHQLDHWAIDSTGLHVRLYDAETDACTRHTWFPTASVLYAEEAAVDSRIALDLVKS